ncbi:hypothetical protein SEA_CAMERICO_85 [Gordonia phage Camerico]|nr:hypothetical protein SEA_CAMERICO_85 [Gordonia phage Camerico]
MAYAGRIKTTITRMTRLQNTASGNPRWVLYTPGGSYRTEPEAQVGSLISEAMIGKEVMLYFNASSRVQKIDDLEAPAGNLIGKCIDLDGKRVRVIRQVDVTAHDAGYRKRVNDLQGLFVVEEEVTGNQLTAYGCEIGMTP